MVNGFRLNLQNCVSLKLFTRNHPTQWEVGAPKEGGYACCWLCYTSQELIGK